VSNDSASFLYKLSKAKEAKQLAEKQKVETPIDKAAEDNSNLSISSSLSWREQSNPKEEKKT